MDSHMIIRDSPSINNKLWNPDAYIMKLMTMFWQHDYESVTWSEEHHVTGDRDRYCYHVTMAWCWHAGSMSSKSESLSGSVSGVPCHRWTSCVSLTWSHPASGLGNSHLWFSLNREIRAYLGQWRLFVTKECRPDWWLMVCVRDPIWQGLSACVTPTCVTCLMSVSVSSCQTGSCQPPATSTFTSTSHWLLSSPRRKTGTQH